VTEPPAPPTEHPFTLVVEGRTVPALLWLPRRGATTPDAGEPLVLLGHGGTVAPAGSGAGAGGKRAAAIVRLAGLLTRHHGVAALAIDLPGAGERPEAPAEAVRRRDMTIDQALREVWTDASIRETIADWQAAVAHAHDAFGVDDTALGYFGVSGGTMYGLPLVAREPRVVVAVLGLNGAVPMMLRHAPDVGCRVLYLHNLDDQFPLAATGPELFAALGSTEKRFHAFPGTHGEFPDDEYDYIAAFLAHALTQED
jgi:dienelactone hydrolase